MSSPTDWRAAFISISHSYPMDGPFMLLESALKKLEAKGYCIPDLNIQDKTILNKIHKDLLDDKRLGFLSEEKYFKILRENIEKVKHEQCV